MLLNNWLTNIQDWLLPRLCPACGGPTGTGRDLCLGCEKSLPILHHACPRCAIPYEHPETQGICGTCQQQPPAFTHTVALYRYAPPVDHFIRAIKFHNDLGLTKMLGQQLAAKVLEIGWYPEVILPIPLHPARLRSRGYNQALELARPVAERLALKPDIDGAERVRDTPSQVTLNQQERQRNLRGAFRVHRDYTGKSVAILDDVMTTGHTAESLSRTLLRAGARDIRVWVIARTAQ
jgi:ComF family protein